MRQVGCGVGNTTFPLLEINPTARVYACDYAPTAVQLVKANPEYGSGRVHAFVADITGALGLCWLGALDAPTCSTLYWLALHSKVFRTTRPKEFGQHCASQTTS